MHLVFNAIDGTNTSKCFVMQFLKLYRLVNNISLHSFSVAFSCYLLPFWGFIKFWGFVKSKQKSNLRYSRGVTLKRVSSGGTLPAALRLGNTASKKRPGVTLCPILTGPGN